ncbi:hypothetical protein JG688_00004859, partial [Phytophthora aleatoria]
ERAQLIDCLLRKLQWPPLTSRSYRDGRGFGKLQSCLRDAPYSTHHASRWLDDKENIPDLTGAQTSKSFKGQGATPIIPFSHDLETFMKDYFKEQQPRRLRRYMARNESHEKGLSALMRLCQRFAAREYEFCPLDAFNNVDETSGYLDMPPLRIWAWKGRKGSAKVKRTQKHAERLTAVVTARADGKKQPILFILRAKSG